MVLSIFFPFELRANAAWNLSPRMRGQKVTWAEAVTSGCCTLTNDMAENEKPVRKGGRHCVAGAPNNQSYTNTSYTPGISMHQFPVDCAVREKWLKFVQRHWVDFQKANFKRMPHCVPSISREVVTKTAWHLLWKVWRTRSGIKSSSMALFPQYMQLCQKFQKN